MASTLTPVDIDQDVKAAVRALWMATEALKEVDQAGPLDGRLPSPMPARYTTIKVEKGERADEPFYSGAGGAGYKAFRTVTLTHYATKDKIPAALATMQTTYIARRFADLVMPSGARTFTLLPADLGHQEQDDTKDRTGAEIWRATYRFQVGTVRGDV